MTQTTQRAVRAAALSLAMLVAMAVSASARLADVPPLANTPDPGVMPFNNGFVVVGTSTATRGCQRPRRRGCRAFPIMYSMDLRSWSRIGYVFDGENFPGWIDVRREPGGRSLWAPEIEPVGNTLVVHYSAFSETGARCIGRAATTFVPDVTTNLRFTDLGNYLRCSDPTGSWSLIDPSLFEAPDGQAYLLYKNDYREAAEKEIAIIKVDNQGKPAAGDKGNSILKAEGWELDTVDGGTGSVEAPTMIYRKGMYYLFYTGNDYRTDRYGVGVARSESPTGRFEKNPGNPILTGVGSRRFCGVGHQDVVHDMPRRRWLIFYHSYRGPQEEFCNDDVGRFMKVQRLRWNKTTGWPYVNRSSKPKGSNTPVEPR